MLMSVRPAGFWPFPAKRIEGLTSNFTFWCIPTVYRTDKIMVMVCCFFCLWRHFDLVKLVKFGVSGHFPLHTWREWPQISHADVSWLCSELIRLWLWSVDFSVFGAILLSETGQIWGWCAHLFFFTLDLGQSAGTVPSLMPCSYSSMSLLYLISWICSLKKIEHACLDIVHF